MIYGSGELISIDLLRPPMPDLRPARWSPPAPLCVGLDPGCHGGTSLSSGNRGLGPGETEKAVILRFFCGYWVDPACLYTIPYHQQDMCIL